MLTKIRYLWEYFLLRAMVFLCALLPFSWIYKCSNVLYILMYSIIRYRRSVVQFNLLKSFPDKTDQERKIIEKEYYHYFAELMLETIKGFSASVKEIQKRWQLVDTELMDQYGEQQRSIIFVSGHYGNWEWGAYVKTNIPHQIVSLYKAVKNKWSDKFFHTVRSRYNLEFVTPKNIVKYMLKNKNRLLAYNFIADQKTLGNSIHKMRFLNQETECMMGPEKCAKLFDSAVFYLSVKFIKQGYYQVHPILITDTPKNTQEGEITEKFMQLLEQDIIAAPQYWMWGHRRWKNLYGRVRSKKKYSPPPPI